MGVFNTTVNGLLSHAGGPMDVIEPAKRGTSGYTNSGTIVPTPVIEVKVSVA
jgi:hypothetical protein